MLCLKGKLQQKCYRNGIHIRWLLGLVMSLWMICAPVKSIGRFPLVHTSHLEGQDVSTVWVRTSFASSSSFSWLALRYTILAQSAVVLQPERYCWLVQSPFRMENLTILHILLTTHPIFSTASLLALNSMYVCLTFNNLCVLGTINQFGVLRCVVCRAANELVPEWFNLCLLD